MEGIGLNARIIDAAKRTIVALFHAQNETRAKLVTQLQAICEKCDNAYSELLQGLAPLKAAQRNPTKFASALRTLTADAGMRKKFKPEQLCSEIDQLLTDLSNNLHALKYSVQYSSIDSLRQTFQSMGNYDSALYHQYDTFMRELDSVATQIDAADAANRKSLVKYGIAEIAALELELRASITAMRAAKAAVIRSI